ncbi:DMT family transporter [Sandaracinobacter neustonicus]|uniref:DMT family transporter n=1 Tax=Sandaracinobacter neustonicus TaxID=1715348 RepID=A0A501XQN2_9SPHN|nr:DMT family transporter [Sandaracinobacter neustonicus]TPE62866.1 DMT family transporter [Sandaracinobacter neustonicus]
MPSAPSSLDFPAARSRTWPFVALILGSACLAFGPMLVRLSDVSALSSAFWRMGLALPVLTLVAVLARRREVAPLAVRALPWGLTLAAGAMFAADLAAWHMGIHRTTVANATLFGNGAAFMLAGWAMLAGWERPERQKLMALGMALAGTLLLLGASAELSPRHLAGDLLCLLAAGFYAGYLIVVMRLRGQLPTATLLAMSTGFSALLLLPVALLGPGAFWPGDWRPLLALAVTSQLVGQGLLVFATGSLPAAVIGVGLLVQPLLAATIGWLVFGETMGPLELLGAAIICAALVLVRR